MVFLTVVRGRYPKLPPWKPWNSYKRIPNRPFPPKTGECPLLSQSFVFNIAGEDPLPDLASWISAIWHNTCRYFFHVETMPKTAPRGESPYYWVLFLFFPFSKSFLLGLLKLIFFFRKLIDVSYPHFVWGFRYNPPWILMIFLIPLLRECTLLNIYTITLFNICVNIYLYE